ncbi:MAG: hypothetical protein IT182_03115 [Acidobacteria bacterium]|nr:hypothetical protein [Acidobacteriota bacterium]
MDGVARRALTGSALLAVALSGAFVPVRGNARFFGGNQGRAVLSGCPTPTVEPRLLPTVLLPDAQLTLARCVQRDLDEGRWRDADARLTAARRAGLVLDPGDRDAWDALILRGDATRLVDGAQWSTLASVSLPGELAIPWVGPLVRGVASARASWATQDAGLQAQARAELDRLTHMARTAGPVSEAERARLIVQGTMAGAQYERDEMQMLLDAAHDLERRLNAGEELLAPVVLAREVEADLLLTTDRYAAAVERYRDVIAEWPRRVQPRRGLAAAYRHLGHAREAEETIAQARALWADADPDAASTLQPRP